VSKGTKSLGIAGCLRYSKVNDLPILLYIILGSAAGLLILLIIAVILYKVIRGKRSSSQQLSADNPAVRSHYTRTPPQYMTRVDASEAGYSKHLSIAGVYDDDDYLTTA